LGTFSYAGEKIVAFIVECYPALMESGGASAGGDEEPAGSDSDELAGGNGDSADADLGDGDESAEGTGEGSTGGNGDESAGGTDDESAGGTGDESAGGTGDESAGGTDDESAGGTDDESAGGNGDESAGGDGHEAAGGDFEAAGGYDNDSAGGEADKSDVSDGEERLPADTTRDPLLPPPNPRPRCFVPVVFLHTHTSVRTGPWAGLVVPLGELSSLQPTAPMSSSGAETPVACPSRCLLAVCCGGLGWCGRAPAGLPFLCQCLPAAAPAARQGAPTGPPTVAAVDGTLGGETHAFPGQGVEGMFVDKRSVFIPKDSLTYLEKILFTNFLWCELDDSRFNLSQVLEFSGWGVLDPRRAHRHVSRRVVGQVAARQSDEAVPSAIGSHGRKLLGQPQSQRAFCRPREHDVDGNASFTSSRTPCTARILEGVAWETVSCRAPMHNSGRRSYPSL